MINLIFLSSLVALGDDIGWDNVQDIEHAWDGQKQITNKEFEDIMNYLERDKKKREAKKKLKGNDINTKDENAILTDEEETTPLLQLYVNTANGEYDIPIGHYKVIGTKENGKIYLNFYQSHSLIGKVLAYETDDDFGEETIYFVKAIPYKSGYMKIIYGSMDFNAYTYLKY